MDPVTVHILTTALWGAVAGIAIYAIIVSIRELGE